MPVVHPPRRAQWRRKQRPLRAAARAAKEPRALQPRAAPKAAVKAAEPAAEAAKAAAPAAAKKNPSILGVWVEDHVFRPRVQFEGEVLPELSSLFDGLTAA